MTRKHFKEIASVISDISDINQRRITALNLAHRFKNFNDNFNFEKFIQACGV